MQDINGKVAFISGGAGGIGSAMAKQLLDAGARVALADLDLDRARAVAAELGSVDRIVAVKLDVTDPSSWAQARDAAQAALGPCDILCSNAGVSFTGTLDEIKPEAWRWVYEVNLFASLHAVQTFLPGMKARGSEGHVLFVSSITALHPFATQGVYSSSKAALLNFAKVLKLELESSTIGVSIMCPGIVATQIRANAIQARPDALRESGGVSSSLSTQMGMAPEHVGRAAIAGIRDNQFYIFPHTDYRPFISADYDAMLSAMQTPADPDYHEPQQLLNPLPR
ncbi:NADP-dependent 3-hydroxy acid dehydrogenase YdfG [Pseudomonas sp. 9AZ]|uniref:SDR family NAD(P)-dependent oxidoreductase n=1 Tax=Pseudomonas sp. 9AZ TaxID=2653168 RepID=UPI0012F0C7D2|nr:SDR family NAD(P)-dependent oxidoreductase [Pseudomonas sp. 9AZ]VXD04357.1 NADP-dependent 3-hydroxy acid dehydrogenase YdfG [Pseudomonas sp. 9AZ]